MNDIPKKLKPGDQFKNTIVNTINDLIDYLTSSRIVKGSGVRLQQYATGTLVSSTAKPGKSMTVTEIPYYDDFTIIKLSETESTISIAIAHGWTWNPEIKRSRYSAMYINDRLFPVSCRILEDLPSSGVHYLYVHDYEGLGLNSPEIEYSSEQRKSDNIDFYYEIGQIIDGQVIQTHRSGALVVYSRLQH